MPIYFSCTKCNKAMWAQDQYAGRRVPCPACSERNLIPTPAAPSSQPLESAPAGANAESKAPVSLAARSTESDQGRDSHLIDMERGPSAPPPVLPAPSAPVGSTPQATLQAGPALVPTTPASADGLATLRCPVCAEIIKAAAKKCRFCNSNLDQDHDADAQKQKAMVIARVLYLAERSAAMWRGLSVVVTGMASGVMLIMTMQALQQDTAAILTLFNVLLIVGMFWSMLQMKEGPAQVFISAALAVMLCMPINMLLGFPIDDQVLKTFQENPQFKGITVDEVRIWTCFSGLFFGILFSIPLWVAALKVAAVQRLKTALGMRS